ncbi:MAG: AbrB family transcriptional regulator [Rhodobacter sp.]|nr:AbrB family transcriptional regulator [Paracoccaceae bacterium]MCC0077033.1 AbrB family transcriptional regulator [Rhodobacter sp.]
MSGFLSGPGHWSDLTSKSLQWAALLSIAFVLSMGLRAVNFPAASLIAPVLVATVMGLRGATIRLPQTLHRLCQGLIGCQIALYLEHELLTGMSEHWAAVITFISLTFLISCLVGWLVGQVARMNHEVAIWGFLPGMAGTMIAMSHERGLDSRIVAFIQILRVVAVILSVAALSWVIVDDPAGVVNAVTRAPVTPLNLLVTAGICAVALLSARFLPFIPGAPTLIPMTVAAALRLAELPQPALPVWLLIPAYLLLGSQVGLRFTPALLRSVLRSLWAIIGGVLLLLALCMVSGAVLATIVGESLITGVLATIPGSIETVALIAVNTHANISFVMTLQVVRLFAVVLLGPAIARWMTAHLPEVRGSV